MKIFRKNCIGLIIDMQEKIFPAMAGGDQLLEKTKKLIEGLKVLEVPMLTTTQYSKGLGGLLPEMTEIIPRGVMEVDKMTFSCCGTEEFRIALKSLHRDTVIVAGIESHVCVEQTVIDLIELGFTTVVATDCISSRNPVDKEMAMRRMATEGAVLGTMESILFELLRKAGTDEFKAISKIVK